MEEHLKNELLTFTASDVKCWDDAAQRCEDLSATLGAKESSEWMLICAVYRERAIMHRDLVAKFQ